MRLTACLVLVVAFWGAPAHAAPILSLQPALNTINVGQTTILDIVVTNAVDLYSYQFDVGFNPDQVSAGTPTEGPFLATGGTTFFLEGVVDNVGGTVSFTANTLLTAINGVNGTGVVARIAFTGVSPGTAPVSLFGVTLIDSTLAGIEGALVGTTLTVAGSTATPVPEPATLALLVSGLLLVWRVGCDSNRRR